MSTGKVTKVLWDRGAFIFTVRRSNKKQLQKFQRTVVPPSLVSSSPSRRRHQRCKALETLVKGGMHINSPTRVLTTTLVYNCPTQNYVQPILNKNKRRNCLTPRQTSLIQNIIQITAELQDYPLDGEQEHITESSLSSGTRH